MTLLLSIIAFLIIFSLLILVHEYGHFIAAKKMGVKVEEFGFGLPPRIWGFKPKKSETLFSINAIPFGGFVRLYGEDKFDSKVLKSSESYVSKSPWQKILIVVAGVFMNLVLAFVLLCLGLIWGMQPLIVSPEQVFDGIKQGVIEVEPGLKVKNVKQAGIGLFEPGDKILQIDEQKVLLGDEVVNLEEGKKYNMVVENRDGQRNFEITYSKENPLAEFYDTVFLPKIAVHQVKSETLFAKAGMQQGDIILSINAEPVFDFERAEELIESSAVLNFEVLRSGQQKSFSVQQNLQPRVVISDVLTNSPAQKAGLFAGDEVLAINEKQIRKISDLIELMKENDGDQIKYTVLRMGNVTEVFITPNEEGMVGVLLADLKKNSHEGLEFFVKTVPFSVLKVNDISVPWFQAPGRALEEISRLSVLTVQMLGGVVSSIVTKFAVPDGVAGPVGIAQMTYTFVQEGFMSLIRFTALLSLSLAILNILPFPGLDGGRLLLILVGMFMGNKLNPRVEGMIHVIGFFLLLMLIFLITYNDILKLFA